MGATLSTQNAKSNLELRQKIDYIAKNLIFDSDFTDMTKLGNEKYCNKLVKTVSDVFKNNNDSIDIVSLRKKLYEIKTKKNQQSDLDFSNDYDNASSDVPSDTGAPAADDAAAPAGADATYVNEKGQQEQLSGGKSGEEGNVKTTRRKSTSTGRRSTPTNSNREKERQRATFPQNVKNIKKKCNEIAKFYVLFAHLFSSIVSTVNPSFETSMSSSDKTKTTNSLDFCSSRLNLLIGDLTKNSEDDITIKPNVCKMNISDTGSALRLVDLPGMKALLKLFKTDGHDSLEDVKYLYKAFTGEKPPNDINIEHIPLKVYNKDFECNGSSSGTSSRNETRGGRPRDSDYYEDERYRDERDLRNLNVDVRSGVYLTGVTGNPTKEKLFSDYIKNIKLMIQKSESNRSLLLEILSEMFSYTHDSDGEISGVIINPSLTYRELQSLVKRTRKIIIKYITDCEEDYNTGLDIFFALIQEKIMFKLTMQDEALRNELEKTIYGKQERYIINKYNQNPFFIQQNQNANVPINNPYIPPHFKQLVIKEIKKILKEKEGEHFFDSIKDDLQAYIAEEIASANGPNMLDAASVANAYYMMQYDNIDDADDTGDADDNYDADDTDDFAASSIHPKKHPIASPPAAATAAAAAPPAAAPPAAAAAAAVAAAAAAAPPAVVATPPPPPTPKKPKSLPPTTPKKPKGKPP